MGFLQFAGFATLSWQIDDPGCLGYLIIIAAGQPRSWGGGGRRVAHPTAHALQVDPDIRPLPVPLPRQLLHVLAREAVRVPFRSYPPCMRRHSSGFV